MPNRKKWIRYVLYAVEILLLFLLQDTPGLLPQIMGVKPLPVLSAALTIAMVEACTPAMAFGMYAGFLADIGSGAVFGYHALTFGVLCFLLSATDRHTCCLFSVATSHTKVAGLFPAGFWRWMRRWLVV